MKFPNWFSTVALLAVITTVHADIKPETVGKETMAEPESTWMLVRNILGSWYIFDTADGKMHGLVDTTRFTPAVQPNLAKGEIYAAESYYSRQNRGERTDVVTTYDLETLAPKAEVKIPNRLATVLNFRQYISLMDDGKHLAVFNMTPGQSVSVVDVESQSFVGEISTPGCALIMQTAGNGFLQICGDGRLQLIRLNDDGTEASRDRSKEVFDIEEDPFFDRPVPTEDGWLIISYQGQVFEVTVDGNDIEVSEPWSLLTDEERAANWRPGGQQFYDYHAGLDLMFVLVNANGGFSHDDAGSEVWIYQKGAQRKIASISLEAKGSNLWVSKGDDPLLSVTAYDQQVHVFDAKRTKAVRTIEEAGVSPGFIQGFGGGQ